jgi:aminopeptidase N
MTRVADHRRLGEPGARATIAKARLAVLAAFMAATAGAPAHAIDEFFPEFGNNGYDVQRYDLDLDVDQERHYLDGEALLTIRATSNLREFSLDLSGLEVTQVKVDGVAARFSQDPGKLRVRPASAVAKGRKFTVWVAYGGVPRPIPDPTAEDPSSIPGLGWTNWERTSYVVSEPVGAGTWYPVNDEPTDKASYRIAVTVDKPYTAVANGVPVSVTDLGARRRFLWEQAQPMASYLAITDIDEYLLDQRQAANGVVIRTYYTDDTPADALEALRQTPAMMAYFDELVGPYPFDGYGAVIVRDPGLTYALETQAMSTFEKDDVDELTVVHELAHQWFGDAVTVAEWRDLWLAEGFATYAEFQWEHRADRPGLEAAMRDLYAYVAENQVGPAVVSRPQDLFADNTYYRGALALHALRLDVGDGDFLKTVRAFYRTYRDKNATSADFIATAVRATGKPSVRRLLRAWLYEEAVPPLPGAEAAVAVARAAGPAPAPSLGVGVRRRR